MSQVVVRRAGPEEFALVESFLREESYRGGTQPSDELVVALEDGRIVGGCVPSLRTWW
jgi:hypothetical protein